MIRINLYQSAPKPRKGKRPKMSTGIGQGSGILLLGLVILLITAAANGIWYWKLNRDAAQIQKDLAQANADYARLTQVKQRYEELEKQKNAYKSRVDVIDELRTRQSGPVNLLAMLGNTVNRTDAVWLSNMQDDGNSVNLKGTALSVHAVADLMRNIKNTGYFNTVEIKSSYQDEKVKDLQAFVFELTCAKQQPAQKTAAQPSSQPKKS